MKKPTWKTLTVLFFVGFCVTTAGFAAYHIRRAKYPAVERFYESSALDTNAITAYFTALAFVGFLFITVYHAYYNAVTNAGTRKGKAAEHEAST